MARAAGEFIPFGKGREAGFDLPVLGVVGVELERLAALGLPLMPGVTATPAGARTLADIGSARAAIEVVEELAGRRVGDPEQPLVMRLFASPTAPGRGSAPEIPGIGLTFEIASSREAGDDTAHAVLAMTVRSIAEHALEVPGSDFDEADFGASGDVERARAFLDVCARAGRPYPEDPGEQLALAVRALRRRRELRRSRRRRNGSADPPQEITLALHLQAVSCGPASALVHGTAESRDPATGEFLAHGTFRRGMRRGDSDNGAGEDTGTPAGGARRTARLPAGAGAVIRRRGAVEFEVDGERFAVFGAERMARSSPRAIVRTAVELAADGTIDAASAVEMVRPSDLGQVLQATLRLTGREVLVGAGVPAAAGAASGHLALSNARAVEFEERGLAPILVVAQTTPEDLPGILAARAVVTTRGGVASHAAVVARSLARPAVCGVSDLVIDLTDASVRRGELVLHEGDEVSVDGSTGRLYAGRVPVVSAQPAEEVRQLLAYADEVRRLRVRANADTGEQAARALELGAEGIGLCRTEHQFLGDRASTVRRYLLARDAAEEERCLEALAHEQRRDFSELFRATGDRPVAVRLLDAPLHEFLGHEAGEVNPMLGLRGVRLAVVRRGLYAAQARALFEAWVDAVEEGMRPHLEVLVPFVSLTEELVVARAQVASAAQLVASERGSEPEYSLGAMLETPRACLIAGEIARHAEFLSFGTNDLTQLTYGLSRDDADTQVVGPYLKEGLMHVSPFSQLDPDGVALLIETAVTRARAVRPGVGIGVCGEHAGEASSITLFERLGVDYLSCSPSLVPGARLAAARRGRERTGGTPRSRPGDGRAGPRPPWDRPALAPGPAQGGEHLGFQQRQARPRDLHGKAAHQWVQDEDLLRRHGPQPFDRGARGQHVIHAGGSQRLEVLDRAKPRRRPGLCGHPTVLVHLVEGVGADDRPGRLGIGGDVQELRTGPGADTGVATVEADHLIPVRLPLVGSGGEESVGNPCRPPGGGR